WSTSLLRQAFFNLIEFAAQAAVNDLFANLDNGPTENRRVNPLEKLHALARDAGQFRREALQCCVIQRNRGGDLPADVLARIVGAAVEFLNDVQHATRTVLIAEGDEGIEDERMDAALKERGECLAFAFVFDVRVLEEFQQVRILLEQLAKTEQFL